MVTVTEKEEKTTIVHKEGAVEPWETKPEHEWSS
jgi:hypothetical protein